MRTIAGQIQNFSFASVTASFEDDFRRAWGQQIGAPVETQNVAGNEHFGASFGGFQPFPATAAAIDVPAKSVMAIRYAVDTILQPVVILWSAVTLNHGRVRINHLDPAFQPYGVQPDPAGVYELTSLAIACAGTTWTTTLTGVYHTGHGLPDVPFTVLFPETIEVAPTVPTSPSLTASAAAPITKADTGKLIAAIHALEAVAAGLPTGIMGIPLLAFGIDQIDALIASELKPIGTALHLLAPVVQAMPRRIDVPGTSDEVVFHYDSVVLPQGQVAVTDALHNVAAVTPGSAITFLGSHPPARTRRTALVSIDGPAAVTLPAQPSSGAGSKVLPTARSYSARVNDEVQAPTFHWTMQPPSPAAAATVLLSPTQGQQVQIEFDHAGHRSPDGVYVLTVKEDDALHLTTAAGQPPAAALHITVTHGAVVAPPPSTVGPPKHILPG